MARFRKTKIKRYKAPKSIGSMKVKHHTGTYTISRCRSCGSVKQKGKRCSTCS